MTRLLGQSPAGLNTTGESDVRNYYDMIAARQELDLRPQLERLDRLICWSEGIDEGALTFAFRPLWQLDEPSKAALALSRAQATQVYAGLGLWPDAVMARLAEAQLIADGTYPNAAAVFAEGGAGQSTADAFPVRPGFNPAQPRDPDGRWTAGSGVMSAGLIIPVVHPINEDPDPTPEEEQEELEEKFKQREDPQRFFRQGVSPDGIIRVPVMPGGGGAPVLKPLPMSGGTEAPADPETLKRGAGPGQTSPGNAPGTTNLPAASTIARPVGNLAPQNSALPSQPSAVPTSLAKPKKLTHQETAVMKEVFREGGQSGNVSGALRLLDQIADGSFTPPEGLIKEILAKYIALAEYSIRTGRDKTGVQVLRLKALNMLMERIDAK